MTVGDPLAAPLGGAAPAPPRGRRSRVLVLAALVVAVLGAAGTASYLRERTAPAVLAPYGNQVTVSATVGQIAYVDSGIETKVDHDLDLRRITPRIARNDAGATVRVLVCARRTGAAGVGFAPLTEESCVSAKAFSPGRIDLEFATTQILFQITPTHTGTLRIDGSDVDYEVGSYAGSQHAGVNFVEQVH